MNNHIKMKTKASLIGFVVTIAITILGLVIGIVPSAYADPPCLHGMRIVGDESIYLSHMGLFKSSCHDYQGIFEVAFTGENDPQQRYLNTQKSDPDKNEFTLRPQDKFVLPDLGSGKIKSFQADLFEGQYERSQTKPKKIAENVTVTVKRVLHFRLFNPSATLPPNLEYLLFGSSKEQYVAHKLTRPNDFDQILAVKNPIPLSDIELSKALPIVFPNRPIQNESEMFDLALKPNAPLKPAIQINGKGVNQTLVVGSQYFRETCDYKENPLDPEDCP
jgi:hypothetical protein